MRATQRQRLIERHLRGVMANDVIAFRRLWMNTLRETFPPGLFVVHGGAVAVHEDALEADRIDLPALATRRRAITSR